MCTNTTSRDGILRSVESSLERTSLERNVGVVAVGVVGNRDGSQVAGTIEHYSSPVPEALWNDLRSAGLLPA